MNTNEDVFLPELVKTDFSVENKDDCLRAIASTFREAGVTSDADRFYHEIKERENTLSTGIGHGIAIPHLRDCSVKRFTIGIYLLDREIDFKSLDFRRVKLIICFAIPVNDGKQYMKMLQKVSSFLRSEKNRQTVFRCEDKNVLIKIFRSITDENK